MEADVAAADAKREEQSKVQMAQGDDPASQLQGLMAARDSLKRIGSAFKAKPNLEKV